MNGIKQIANGLNDADNWWITLFANEEGALFDGRSYSAEEAIKVLDYCKRKKYVKADHIMRKYILKDSGVLDAEFIESVLLWN